MGRIETQRAIIRSEMFWQGYIGRPPCGYICPTCGRPQHPGQTCRPGHADDDEQTTT